MVGGGGAYLIHLGWYPNESSRKLDSDTTHDTNVGYPQSGEKQNGLTISQDFDDYLRELKQFEADSLTENTVKLEATIYSFVAHLPERALEPVLASLTNSSIQHTLRVRHKLQRALLERLAISNPKIASDYAIAHDLAKGELALSVTAPTSFVTQFGSPPTTSAQISLTTLVYCVWAKINLNAAITHANELDEEFRNRALMGILESQQNKPLEDLRKIAESLGNDQYAVDVYLASFNVEKLADPRLAWSEIGPYVTSLNLPRKWVLKNVVLQWYEQEGIDIVDEIQASTASTSIKSAIIRLVLTNAVKHEPELTFRHALKVSNDSRFRALIVRDVIRTWARLDADAAYKILDEVDEVSLRDSLRHTVVNIWARNDPHDVLEHINSFPPDLEDGAITIALVTIALSAPQEAAKRALQVTNPSTRSMVLNSVLSAWMQQDLEQSIDWIAHLETTDKQRYDLVGILTSKLVAYDPHRAFELARNESVVQSWTGLEAGVIRAIVRSGELVLAVELLDRVREGKTRVTASTRVAEHLIRQGNIEQALKIGFNLPESEQESYFPRISYAWSEVDPDGILDTIEHLPTAVIRSRFVFHILDSYSRDNFTESQLETLKQYLNEEDRAKLNPS